MRCFLLLVSLFSSCKGKDVSCYSAYTKSFKFVSGDFIRLSKFEFLAIANTHKLTFANIRTKSNLSIEAPCKEIVGVRVRNISMIKF
jgi:hypothetical protein